MQDSLRCTREAPTSRGISSRSKSEQRERKHQERECFAMAALASCLTHLPFFRRYFLKVVCAISRPQSQPKIGIEDKLWGDLVIRTNNAIFVIEGRSKQSCRTTKTPQKVRRFGSEAAAARFSNSLKIIQTISCWAIRNPSRCVNTDT